MMNVESNFVRYSIIFSKSYRGGYAAQIDTENVEIIKKHIEKNNISDITSIAQTASHQREKMEDIRYNFLKRR